LRPSTRAALPRRFSSSPRSSTPGSANLSSHARTPSRRSSPASAPFATAASLLSWWRASSALCWPSSSAAQLARGSSSHQI
jgi:hypothetical protein